VLLSDPAQTTSSKCNLCIFGFLKLTLFIQGIFFASFQVGEIQVD